MELKLDTTKVYAIALEGGGARGAYQVGAWRALEEAGIRYNAVSGTSVGAINGTLMAMRDLNQAEQIWKDIHGAEKLQKAMETAEILLKKKGIDFDAEEMKILIEAAVAEFNGAFAKPLIMEDTADAVRRVEQGEN